MFCISKEDLMSGDQYFRRNLVNSLVGFKSANLIGTCSSAGRSNLSLISSVVHVGASPPIQGFIMRPLTVERQTYQFIRRTGQYTINHVHSSFIDKAHYASAKFDAHTSEFTECQLTEEYLGKWKAPFVREAHLKLAMSYLSEYEIKENGTILILGTVERIFIDHDCLLPDGNIDLGIAQSVAVSGLECYYTSKKEAQFSYAREGQWPQNHLEKKN